MSLQHQEAGAVNLLQQGGVKEGVKEGGMEGVEEGVKEGVTEGVTEDDYGSLKISSPHQRRPLRKSQGCHAVLGID